MKAQVTRKATRALMAAILASALGLSGCGQKANNASQPAAATGTASPAGVAAGPPRSPTGNQVPPNVADEFKNAPGAPKAPPP